MKLLLDQNLSHRLVESWLAIFPESAHAGAIGLDRADDTAIWQHARSGGFVIVSKDDDFRQRSLVFGHPPKVIWLKVGNCSTGRVDELIRAHVERIHMFGGDPHSSLLVLTPTGSATR